MSTTRVLVRTVTPSRASWAAADADRSGGYIGRIRSTASMSSMRASCGRIDRKSERSVSLAISPSAPASSTPVGPPPTSDEGHPLPAPVGICLALRRLERDQDPAPDLRRVVDGLETRRVRRPVVVAEVAVPGAGRDDQRVVREVEAVTEPDLGAAGSIPIASPSRTVVLRCLRKIERSGCAMSPGDRRRSPPGRAAAGTGGGCVGRPA